jgi:hypothetical protein
VSFADDAQESSIILGFVEDTRPADTPIEDMVDVTAGTKRGLLGMEAYDTDSDVSHQ